MERFGEKSYFYRKMNGLSPADSDDDPDLVGDDVHAHGFEEPEEEENVDTLEEEAMEVDTDEVYELVGDRIPEALTKASNTAGLSAKGCSRCGRGSTTKLSSCAPCLYTRSVEI